MATIYYPSCKFTAFSPDSSKEISDYLARRFGMTVAGCCRPAHGAMTEDDTAVCICNTCATICGEDSKAKVVSIWEILQNDDEFPFPDLHHEKMTLQDCWRCRDNRAEQDAVRNILRKINVDIVEQEENYDKTHFCGTTLYQPLPEANGRFAPRHFIEEAEGMFRPHTPEEQRALMEAHCANIHTDKVICYCVPCTQGIRTGGKQGIHLMDLLLHADKY